MEPTTHDSDAPPTRSVSLWFGLLGGPLAWTAHLLASHFLVEVLCARGGTDDTSAPLAAVWILMLTVVLALICLAAAAAGWRARVRFRAGPGDLRGAGSALATLGVFLGVSFAIVTLVQGLPPAFMQPCPPL